MTRVTVKTNDGVMITDPNVAIEINFPNNQEDRNESVSVKYSFGEERIEDNEIDVGPSNNDQVTEETVASTIFTPPTFDSFPKFSDIYPTQAEIQDNIIPIDTLDSQYLEDNNTKAEKMPIDHVYDYVNEDNVPSSDYDEAPLMTESIRVTSAMTTSASIENYPIGESVTSSATQADVDFSQTTTSIISSSSSEREDQGTTTEANREMTQVSVLQDSSSTKTTLNQVTSSSTTNSVESRTIPQDSLSTTPTSKSSSSKTKDQTSFDLTTSSSYSVSAISESTISSFIESSTSTSFSAASNVDNVDSSLQAQSTTNKNENNSDDESQFMTSTELNSLSGGRSTSNINDLIINSPSSPKSVSNDPYNTSIITTISNIDSETQTKTTVPYGAGQDDSKYSEGDSGNLGAYFDANQTEKEKPVTDSSEIKFPEAVSSTTLVSLVTIDPNNALDTEVELQKNNTAVNFPIDSSNGLDTEVDNGDETDIYEEIGYDYEIVPSTDYDEEKGNKTHKNENTDYESNVEASQETANESSNSSINFPKEFSNGLGDEVDLKMNDSSINFPMDSSNGFGNEVDIEKNVDKDMDRDGYDYYYELIPSTDFYDEGGRGADNNVNSDNDDDESNMETPEETADKNGNSADIFTDPGTGVKVEIPINFPEDYISGLTPPSGMDKDDNYEYENELVPKNDLDNESGSKTIIKEDKAVNSQDATNDGSKIDLNPSDADLKDELNNVDNADYRNGEKVNNNTIDADIQTSSEGSVPNIIAVNGEKVNVDNNEVKFEMSSQRPPATTTTFANEPAGETTAKIATTSKSDLVETPSIKNSDATTLEPEAKTIVGVTDTSSSTPINKLTTVGTLPSNNPTIPIDKFTTESQTSDSTLNTEDINSDNFSSTEQYFNSDMNEASSTTALENLLPTPVTDGSKSKFDQSILSSTNSMNEKDTIILETATSTSPSISKTSTRTTSYDNSTSSSQRTLLPSAEPRPRFEDGVITGD